jgi:hypothetical protein
MDNYEIQDLASEFTLMDVVLVLVLIFVLFAFN